MVLWTRLAPKPLEGGGMPDLAVEVEWRLAEDEGMKKVVKKGTAMATPVMVAAVGRSPNIQNASGRATAGARLWRKIVLATVVNA